MKKFAFAIAAVAAIASFSTPASAEVYGSMNVGVALGGRPAPYYAPPRAAYRGVYYEEGYQTRGSRGYNYNRAQRVRIEPENLSGRKYRCDAATKRPTGPDPYSGNAWCDPD